MIQRQKIMEKVLLALLPCIAGAVYYFGWYCLFIIALANITGFVIEYIFARRLNKPVSEAVFVTSTLFGLVMPPTVPWYVVIIGMVFAIMFGKMVFGGFGKNIFNPAVAGRAFVYVCFPIALTGTWAPAAEGIWGALGKWTTAPTTDAISGATPMAYLKADKISLGIRMTEDRGRMTDKIPHNLRQGQSVVIKKTTLLKGLLFGRISGTAGVTSVILICIGGIYLFITKTASRALILSTIMTYAFWNELLFRLGVEPVPGAWPAVFGGGFLFGAFFMVTDPVSSPKTESAKILYGMIIATSTMVIRNFSIFNGGLMFSILIGNMFAPTLDSIVRHFQRRGKQPVVEDEK
ncbi:MAG: RnfABCDGE type electron transport complex subunit D [Sedimentisphaerales bacterium]|nr:RnfABCDGE type electron transport complex subunit D [Sedimentisphaerales bacterium]